MWGILQWVWWCHWNEGAKGWKLLLLEGVHSRLCVCVLGVWGVGGGGECVVCIVNAAAILLTTIAGCGGIFPSLPLLSGQGTWHMLVQWMSHLILWIKALSRIFICGLKVACMMKVRRCSCQLLYLPSFSFSPQLTASVMVGLWYLMPSQLWWDTAETKHKALNHKAIISSSQWKVKSLFMIT